MKAKIITTTSDIKRLIIALAMTEKTMTCLEKLTFLNKSPLFTIDNIPIFVASLKKFQMVIPKRRAIAKCLP